MVSEIFRPERWQPVDGFAFTDVTYHATPDRRTVRVAFDRPEVRNAFRPHTVDELYTALDHARQWTTVGCVLITSSSSPARRPAWSGPPPRSTPRARPPCACSSTASTCPTTAWSAYGTEEAQEGRDAFLEKRKRDFSRFRWHF